MTINFFFSFIWNWYYILYIKYTWIGTFSVNYIYSVIVLWSGKMIV